MTVEAADRLSDAFATALGGLPPDPAPAALLGLEHEYQLWQAGLRIDFRELIHALDVPGRRLDPGDTNAYRLTSGLALTADEAEAEVASPPVAARPGFSRALDAWGTAGRAQIVDLLPVDIDVRGFSTHLSASLTSPDAASVAELFARTFAPVLALLLDEPDGFGVYVRPRPGRLELCAGHASGRYLRAASIFFAGATRACAAAVAGDHGVLALLPPLDVNLRPATGRFGAYVGRRAAFGFDLYAAGRDAALPVLGGGSVRLGEHLVRAWAAARACIASDTSADEIDLVDRIVAADLPLRVEAGASDEDDANTATPSLEPGATILDATSRPDFVLSPAIATWDFTVFRVEGGQRRAFASVPRAALSEFIRALDAGGFDTLIRDYLAEPANGRRLRGNAMTRAPGLWDELGPSLGLLASEPDPETGRYETPASPSAGARPSKPGDVALPGRYGKPFLAGGPDDAIGDGMPRFGKPAAVGRYGKPLLPPARTVEAAPSSPAPPLPVPPSPPPSRPDETLPPAEPDAPPPSEPEAPKPPGRPLLPIIIAVIVTGVLVAVAAAAGGVFDGATPAATSTATPTLTAAPTLTASPTPSSTPAVTATPTVRPTATVPVIVSVATATPAPPTIAPPAPTETPRPPAPTETPRPPAPTETPRPTATATCGPVGAAGGCTPTPTPVRTPTATPTRTPTPVCTPSPGTNCPPTLIPLP